MHLYLIVLRTCIQHVWNFINDIIDVRVEMTRTFMLHEDLEVQPNNML